MKLFKKNKKVNEEVHIVLDSYVIYRGDKIVIRNWTNKGSFSIAGIELPGFGDDYKKKDVLVTPENKDKVINDLVKSYRRELNKFLTWDTGK